MASTPPRYLILADEKLGVFDAKTANGLIRYRPDAVVGVVDSVHAGSTTRQILDSPTAIPIVSTIAEGLALEPNALVIGISPAGGALPESWRHVITTCLRRGLDVVSGLHTFLKDDAEFCRLSQENGGELVDLRQPPDAQPIARARAKTTRAKRVLMVGTDANVGKMTAALEVCKAVKSKGIDARFIATGQTGILIAGSGIPLDRIAGDFMAGCLENLILENADADWLFVEGQGSLLHPAFSGLTAALLLGSMPDYMVLCQHAGRRLMRAQTEPIPPLQTWVALYEAFMAPIYPSKVVGIAVNCSGLGKREADEAVDLAAMETGLPVADVIRGGVEPLLEALSFS